MEPMKRIEKLRKDVYRAGEDLSKQYVSKHVRDQNTVIYMILDEIRRLETLQMQIDGTVVREV